MFKYSSQADKNRKKFGVSGITAVILTGGTGAGRTSILKATRNCLGKELRVGLVEGGWYNDLDAARMSLNNLDLLFFDLPADLAGLPAMDAGDELKVLVYGVDGGSDRLFQQPQALSSSHVLLLNKIDLLHNTCFDVRDFKRQLYGLNPGIRLFPVSARTGVGMADWCKWLKRVVDSKELLLQKEA